MHVEINAYSVIFVCVVTLGGEHEQTGELRIAIERSDAFDDILVEHLEQLARDNNLPADESGTAVWNFLIEDPIQLSGILER